MENQSLKTFDQTTGVSARRRHRGKMNLEENVANLTLEDLRTMIARQLRKSSLRDPASRKVICPPLKEMQEDEKDLQEILSALARSDVIDALTRRGVTLEEIALTRKEVATLADELKRVTGARIQRRRHTGLKIAPAAPSVLEQNITSRL
jgi:hypothetical protein